jgi:hypothetical protein
MLTSIASLRPLKQVAFAFVGLWIFAAPADAGMINAIRTPEAVDYVATEVYSQGANDLQAYWKDEVEWLDWNSPRGVIILNSRFYGPKDQELLVTMLSAPGVCGIRECPVRIFTRYGDLVMQTSACDETSFHRLSPDKSVFIACGIEHRIEKDPSARDTHASPASTRRFWHNGSIVEASFGSDRSVRIRYVDPKDSLPSYMNGLVLFDGQIDRRGGLAGTAYAFKAGCQPAPYAVNGVFRSTNIALAGASPTRDPHSCTVTGYTSRSPNARLSFVDLTMANR